MAREAETPIAGPAYPAPRPTVGDRASAGELSARMSETTVGFVRDPDGSAGRRAG